MFFILSKIIDVFLSPYTWGLIFAAFALRTKNTWKLSARAWGVLGIALLYVFSFEPVPTYLWATLEDSAENTVRKDETYDAVILLGGLLDEGSFKRTGRRSYNDNVDRLLATFEMLRSGRAKYVIISGGSPSTTIENAEARILRDQLVLWGIESERVLFEDLSRNTRENAVYSKKMAEERGFTKLILVTSAFHMKRALGCFRAVGLPVDTLPVDYRANPVVFAPYMLIPRSHFLNDSCVAIREFAGRAIYRMRGYSAS